MLVPISLSPKPKSKCCYLGGSWVNIDAVEVVTKYQLRQLAPQAGESVNSPLGVLKPIE